jgi:hypothetical protein
MIDCTANNAVLESISCGLPVVTSELSSLQSYIDPSFSTMVSKGSVEEYVCVIRGHKASGAGYEKAAKLARKAAEAKSWKTIVRSVVSMYEE